MTKKYEIEGLNGYKNPRKCIVLIFEKHTGLKWYVEEGNMVVNATYDEIKEGENICELNDVDCFTWDHSIRTLDELEEAVES